MPAANEGTAEPKANAASESAITVFFIVVILKRDVVKITTVKLQKSLEMRGYNNTSTIDAIEMFNCQKSHI